MAAMRWRLPCSFAALANLALIVVSFLLAVTSTKVSYESLHVLIWHHFGPFAFFPVLALDLGAALLLLKCTLEKKDLKLAMERSWLWLYFNVIFISISVAFWIYIWYGSKFDLIAVDILFRMAIMCVAAMFIKELSRAVASSYFNNSTTTTAPIT